QEIGDRLGHRGAAGHGQRAALAEVALHVGDDERAHVPTVPRAAARLLGAAQPPTSAGVPAVMRSSSAYVGGNTGGGCPPAAPMVSCRSSQVSTRVRIGCGWPTGATPPMAWPVQARTDPASARRTAATPASAAAFAVSTRCAPLVMMSRGLS